MSNIPERNQKYQEGLVDFINYINQSYPVKNLTILEVGSWTGCSSEIFAESFKEVHCIDAWKKDKRDKLTINYNIVEAEKIFDGRKDKYKNIYKYKGDWEHFVKLFKASDNEYPDNFDVIYIDMNKLFQDNLNCNIAFFPLAKKYMSGHDYEKRFLGVKQAVHKVYGRPQLVFPDTSWIVKINKFIGGRE